MDKLYCPWRSDYVEKEANKKDENSSSSECIFCSKFKENNDEKNLILRRFKNCAIIMNKYPYNAGHLMVIPFEHQSKLSSYSKEVRSEIMELVSLSIETLSTALSKCPDGFNIGANLGKAAGAGIPAHIHLHVLPRWEGDTNFMPLIAETKQISFDLNKIYATLKIAFDKI